MPLSKYGILTIRTKDELYSDYRPQPNMVGIYFIDKKKGNNILKIHKNSFEFKTKPLPAEKQH